jgi:hypothetical protein
VRRIAARLALAAVLAAVVAACGGTTGPDMARLTVENRTDTPIGVYVDGEWVGTDEPGATIATGLGPTTRSSYRIEAHSPSGAVLAVFEAPRAAVAATVEGGAPLGEAFGVPCGEIHIIVGELGPAEAVAPAPAPAAGPGPCP